MLFTTLLTPALAQDEPPQPRVCMNATDSREAVQDHGLIEPLAAVRSAQASVQAAVRPELLNSRLCRWDNDFVYEVALLRRDGHVVRIFMNAKDGKFRPALGSKESPR